MHMIRYKLAKISGAFASDRIASRALKQIIPTLGEKKICPEVPEQNQVPRLFARIILILGFGISINQDFYFTTPPVVISTRSSIQPLVVTHHPLPTTQYPSTTNFVRFSVSRRCKLHCKWMAEKALFDWV